MGYTVYTQKLARTGRLPTVTIGRSGAISLSAPICRIFKKHGIEAVVLLSDLEGRKIALLPTTRNEKWSYAVRYNQSCTQASVSAASFLMSIGWGGKKYKIDASWDEANSLVEFRMPGWGRSEKGKLGPLPVKKQKAG